ncbi:tetratricopeptide repeat protein 23 isoform X2 [Sphaeramia orbicularis]|uniref:tetratricopeptide repeat protein 23 isoform X2 n=1 Tax=Sphaeramia orbicularis TaxID=375764 RepID=UPI00117CA733|nr:tetratricopeptide repeat protein 23-like isoform X2 [Sphaeramia orbicularis]
MCINVAVRVFLTSPKPVSRSPQSMESISRDMDVSSDCGPNGESPSLTGYTKKKFIMMPPEEKLKHFDSRAQVHADNKEFDVCIQDLVHCVALTRLVYGEGHLKLAQAHARLAKAYFQFKGWGLQALQHSSLAREMLPFSSSISSGRGDKLEVLQCLLDICLIQGGAGLLTATLEEAESAYLEAEQIIEELHQNDGISQEEKISNELEISSGLSRVYRRQSRPDEALNQCEKSLRLLKDCSKPERSCSVYRDMAAIEQDQGQMDRAIEHLSKAHAISMSHGPEELEGAQISHSLALILSAVAEPQHNERAGEYFEQSLSGYRSSVGAHDPVFLSAQDDFCRFLLLNGQQQRCVEIQRVSLSSKRSVFGDLSAEVADTLQLIGSVEMTEGRMKEAHRNMAKCLEIQSLLYGSQHKKTKATQKAVDMLARAPEVAERLQRQDKGKTKPHTFSSVQSDKDGNSISDL